MDKKTKVVLVVIGLGFLSLVGMLAYSFGQKRPEPSASPRPSPLVSPSPEISALPSPSPTKKPSPLPSPNPSPSPSPSPVASPSPSPQADLFISEYSFNHPPKQGEAFTVKIGLYNQGNAPAAGFWWEWWPTKYNFACRARIDAGLPAHGGQIIYCTYTYGGWANYETRAVADAVNEVVESDETNNSHVENVVPIH